MTSIKFDKSEFAERRQRLISCLDEKPTPFAKRIGVSRAFMNDVLHLRSGPSVQMIYGITNYRPDISVNWLLTGRGEMLLKDEGEAEKQRLLAEYWQTNYHLLETGLKIAYQRVADGVGEEEAGKIFEEVKLEPEKGD
ncbi:MAG: hypothetical protein IIA60_00960 [Candidatus Marinimicrobia bacterium]|nr:hypothetical protein [Candidatus Neomarinimicrobiota bacterium]